MEKVQIGVRPIHSIESLPRLKEAVKMKANFVKGVQFAMISMMIGLIFSSITYADYRDNYYANLAVGRAYKCHNKLYSLKRFYIFPKFKQILKKEYDKCMNSINWLIKEARKEYSFSYDDLSELRDRISYIISFSDTSRGGILKKMNFIYHEYNPELEDKFTFSIDIFVKEVRFVYENKKIYPWLIVEIFHSKEYFTLEEFREKFESVSIYFTLYDIDGNDMGYSTSIDIANCDDCNSVYVKDKEYYTVYTPKDYGIYEYQMDKFLKEELRFVALPHSGLKRNEVENLGWIEVSSYYAEK